MKRFLSAAALTVCFGGGVFMTAAGLSVIVATDVSAGCFEGCNCAEALCLEQDSVWGISIA
jgi:hypothetical protein